LSIPAGGAAQELTLNRVLARAAEYVAKLHDRLSSIVAEERYQQGVATYGRFTQVQVLDRSHRETTRPMTTASPTFCLAAIVAVVLAIGEAAPAATRTQKPSLDHVLARAAEYVARFHAQLSGIVAEETYRQHAWNDEPSRPSRVPGKSDSDVRRTLQSDLLLVRPGNADRYVEFRDVFAVDGSPTRDREERLTQLFLSPNAAASNQLRAIIEESARHNIGQIPRNINTPMLALSFLQSRNQRRFRFTRAKASAPELAAPTPLMPGDGAVFRTSIDIWVIEFKETQSPTIIKTNRNRDFRAAGRFWIEPDTGTVRMSELVMESRDVSANILVSYQSEPLLGFLVPIEMRERYRSQRERVEGAATYGRFRQFQVRTDAMIGKPPG
jgi:hypothetical protein